MTLSKAEWRAVRPDRLKDLSVAKLMETLRKPTRDTIEDWQDRLATCDELQRVLDRTPRMLRTSITPAYRRALEVWHADLDHIRKDGKRALDDLAMAHLDEVCTAHAAVVEAEALALVAQIEAQVRRDRRKGGNADPGIMAGFQATLGARAEAIRVLRRQRMSAILREDRTAHAMMRAKHVNLRRFKMRCDPMLKALQKTLTDLQKALAATAGTAGGEAGEATRSRKSRRTV
jgi:hypothetical protein